MSVYYKMRFKGKGRGEGVVGARSVTRTVTTRFDDYRLRHDYAARQHVE